MDRKTNWLAKVAGIVLLASFGAHAQVQGPIPVPPQNVPPIEGKTLGGGTLESRPPPPVPGRIIDDSLHLRCKRDETMFDGRCIKPATACRPPAELRNGHCVTKATSVGGGGGVSRDALDCIVIKTVRGNDVTSEYGTITNICKSRIAIVYCHSASPELRTKDTECGYGGRYFQQFTQLEPGETIGNPLSLPAGTHIYFGACFGDDGSVKTTGNRYRCESAPATAKSTPSPAPFPPELLEMSDRLDAMDKEEFEKALERAYQCRMRRDFACAEREIIAASKVASGAEDRRRLSSELASLDAGRRLLAEQRAQADEMARQTKERAEEAGRRARAQLEEEGRQATAKAEEEARLARAQAEEGRRQEQASRAGAEFAGAIIGAMLGGMARGNSSMPSLSPAPVQRPSSASSGANTVTASRGPESWTEDLTMKYPDRESRERKTVSAGAVANMKSPGGLRMGQGGQVVQHQGCGSCGVGSSILVVVRYPSMNATYTYRYTRNQ